MERTFAMIKPDAVRTGNCGRIIAMIEDAGFEVLGMRKAHLTREQVEQFYAVHKARPFFGEMVDFIVSGPVVLLALQRENAVAAWRELMGATDPHKSALGTVRKLFGANIGSNAAHGSDATQTAQEELALFFPELSK